MLFKMKILFLLAFILVAGCNAPVEPPPPFHKWTVKMCNSIGCDYFPCESYKHVSENTYVLYDSTGNVINELTISAGIFVKIQLNKP
jgi:hypothetical protein